MVTGVNKYVVGMPVHDRDPDDGGLGLLRSCSRRRGGEDGRGRAVAQPHALPAPLLPAELAERRAT